MIVSDKDIPNKQQALGQYMTPVATAEFCISKICIPEKLVIEPSAGKGVFVDVIRKKTDAEILGLELDVEMISQYKGMDNIVEKNFYDYNDDLPHNVHFIGNPPYRTPAFSLSTHTKYIKALRKKYNLPGLREEAALFIVKTVDLMIESGVGGQISYILPKAIFKNNSKSFTAFTNFLKDHLDLVSVWDLDSTFEGVNRDLMWVNWGVKSDAIEFMHNGEIESIDDFYGVNSDMIPHQQIFKKTSLGSVPCESIFLSCRGESLDHFRKRLVKLFSTKVTEDNLIELLSYEGQPHLRALQNKNENKIKVITEYVQQTKDMPNYDASSFSVKSNYKPIRHRLEDRHYFRVEWLKRAPYVYQINPNPCSSFYFPGNPNSSSKGYFGFCDYDINRNSGPGANRTVAVDGLEDNITDSFKKIWNKTGLPYEKIFDYILWVSESDWYKDIKSKYSRFYFSVPAEVPKEFLKEVKR
ncbi:MAG: hypothetical protein ACW99G_07250 [Candidatus Thorarchaeota archaeon]